MKTIDRIAQDFVEGEVPPFPCPTCGDPLVARKEGFHFDPSKESSFLYEHVDSDPTIIRGVFTLRLVCSRSTCHEAVSCVGSFQTIQDEHPSGEPEYLRCLSPLLFVPTICLFPLTSELTDRIKKPLVDSFSVFWTNSNAAANSLRISVEALMDYRRIKKWVKRNDGKEVEINLHDRILAYQKTAPDIGEKLLAIKWLGNSGSHLTGLERKDVIKGYTLYSHVLEELFENRTENLDKLAKKINRRRGPA